MTKKCAVQTAAPHPKPVLNAEKVPNVPFRCRGQNPSRNGMCRFGAVHHGERCRALRSKRAAHPATQP